MARFDPFKPYRWQLARGRTLELGPKGILMGILNVTPDSFSDGGRFENVQAAIRAADKMRRSGAVIIDIGGESTKPGAQPVSAKQEQQRVIPVIEALAEKGDWLISIDTWRASTAKLAIRAGAHIINDVWGFQKDKKIASVAAESGAGCVLMHNGRERTRLADPIKDHFVFMKQSLQNAKNNDVSRKQIILDPGFGFAKDTDENIELLARMDELFKLGQPILTGTSRKRFIGAIIGRSTSRRDDATAATTVIARLQGSAIFRVHNVPKNRDALAVADAVLHNKNRTHE